MLASFKGLSHYNFDRPFSVCTPVVSIHDHSKFYFTNSYALMISTLLLPSKVLKGIGCNRKKCAKEVDSSIDVGNYVVNKV